MSGRREEIAELGQAALGRLFELAENEGTQEKNRIDIYKWLVEMSEGKPSSRGAQADAPPQPAEPVRFEGELDEWAR